MDTLLHQDSSTMEEEEESRKRAAPPSSQPAGGRSKRNRYVSIACNECKRRKIRCNGQTPCERCGNLKLECIYAPNCCTSSLKDAAEFKQLVEQVENLQSQVDLLWQALGSTRAGQDGIAQQLTQESYDSNAIASNPFGSQSVVVDPALSSTERPRPPNFQSSGPSTLEGAQSVRPDPAQYVNAETSNRDQSNLSRQNDGQALSSEELHPEKDPVWGIRKEQALHLCKVYGDHIGPLYPIVDLARVTQHAQHLFNFIAAAWSSGLFRAGMGGADALNDPDTDILKLVMALALMYETGHPTELSQTLFNNVSKGNDTRLHGKSNLNLVRVLILQAIYHVHSNDEKLGCRVLGLASRFCQEMDLHRPETYESNGPFASDIQAAAAARDVVLTIYTLDHRWDAGTGLHWTLHDYRLLPSASRPSDDSRFVQAIAEYTRIDADIVRMKPHFRTNLNEERFQILHDEIKRWTESLPETAQTGAAPVNQTPGLARRHLLLRLQSGQLQIEIQRLYLDSFMYSNPMDLNVPARVIYRLLELSTKQILQLHEARRNGLLDAMTKILFSRFLSSVFAACFLEAFCRPNTLRAQSRDDLEKGLELVDIVRVGSQTSRRFTRTARFINAVLFSDIDGAASADDAKLPFSRAQQDAAIAMADLAGHDVSDSTFEIDRNNVVDRAKFEKFHAMLGHQRLKDDLKKGWEGLLRPEIAQRAKERAGEVMQAFSDFF